MGIKTEWHALMVVVVEDCAEVRGIHVLLQEWENNAMTEEGEGGHMRGFTIGSEMDSSSGNKR